MQLIAKSGEIYAHLFENVPAGLARNLYWNISVELKPIEFHGDRWESEFLCEWLLWPIRSIGELNGVRLADVIDLQLVESSVYLVGRHHPAAISELTVRRTHTDRWELDVSGIVDADLDGQRQQLPFRLQCNLEFIGIVVVPESLFPKLSTPGEVSNAVIKFIGLEEFEDARFDSFRYVLAPKVN